MDHQRRILVVEDDTILAQLTSMILVKANYTVKLVHNGQQALEALHSYKPHLILLDMYLPIVSGWEFLKNYSEAPGEHVPVIVTSVGRLDAKSLDGVVAFVPKPFTNNSLLDTIEACLVQV